ncbi:MAG: HEAT repeat domain-containing protein [Chloroflexi bacterium]|nr:HEAT repeat domain-containing protein [Chloroflexota bacterium]
MRRCFGPRDETRHLWGESSAEQGLAAAPFALPGDERHFPRDRVVDLKHVRLTVGFNLEAKQVIGTAELTLQPVTDDARRVELDCEDTVVNSVSVDGRPAEYALTDRQLIVEFPKPPKSRTQVVVKVDYVATPRRGIYFTGPDKAYPEKPVQVWTQGQDTDNHHWFPCIDEPRGRITSEVIVTVPQDWTAVSNGRLVEESSDQESKTKTLHWRQDKPHAVYLITLAASNFARVVLKDSKPLIDFYVQKGREADGKRSFGNTPAMISLYEDLFGEPYPWDKYTQVAVQDFIFGGMENTSATTQTDLTLHDERAHVDFSSDFLVSHEAVHQWFGDLLTCRDWSHGWLNEGFATYFESVWQEHHRGLDEHLWDVLGMARGYMSETYRRPIVENTFHTASDLFDRHLYEKGGVVLHMLRRELGDEQFYRAIRHYVASYRGRNVTTPDFERAIEESTGRSMDWFFDQWVYKPGHPEFKVTYAWDSDKKTATLGVRQTQSGDGVTRTFRANVDVVFVTAEGRQVFGAKIFEREHTLTYVLPARPKLVQFDAGYGVLKTLDFTKSKDLLEYQLERDEDAIGRIEAAEGLGKLASLEAVKALKRAVLKDKFWAVQATAARQLGKIGSDSALDALLACTGVQHPKARRGVADGLGGFKDQRAAQALVKMLKQDDSYYVAMTAATSLGKTRWEKAFEPLVEALDRPAHLEAIRTGALAGIAELKDDRGVKVATQWTAYGKPQRAREAAIGALGKLGENKTEVVDTLIDLLDDPWLRVRQRSASSLGGLKEQRAIPHLSRLVDRELDGRVVRDARVAIKAIRDGKNAPDDVKKLRDDLHKVEEENRSLRGRLEKIERQLDDAAKAARRTAKGKAGKAGRSSARK